MTLSYGMCWRSETRAVGSLVGGERIPMDQRTGDQRLYDLMNYDYRCLYWTFDITQLRSKAFEASLVEAEAMDFSRHLLGWRPWEEAFGAYGSTKDGFL